MTPRGARALIEMRKKGQRPVGVVWIEYGNGPDPDWWMWSNTEGQPEILVKPEDSIELLDLRCFVDLEVILFCVEWCDRVGRLYERLQDFAKEITVMSVSFGEDIGWHFIKPYGRIDYGEAHWIEKYSKAKADATFFARRDDKAGHQEAQQREKQIIENAPWLSTSLTA